MATPISDKTPAMIVLIVVSNLRKGRGNLGDPPHTAERAASRTESARRITNGHSLIGAAATLVFRYHWPNGAPGAYLRAMHNPGTRRLRQMHQSVVISRHLFPGGLDFSRGVAASALGPRDRALEPLHPGGGNLPPW
jgi:hypothetical protein